MLVAAAVALMVEAAEDQEVVAVVVLAAHQELEQMALQIPVEVVVLVVLMVVHGDKVDQAALALSLFATLIHTPLQHQQQEHQPSQLPVVIVCINGPAMVQLLSR